MGYPWQVALTAVLVEGIIFIVMSLTNVREAIFNAIPVQLKVAVSVGIGFFIAFIGVQNAGIIVDGATLVSLYSFTNGFANGTFASQGVGAVSYTHLQLDVLHVMRMVKCTCTQMS